MTDLPLSDLSDDAGPLTAGTLAFRRMCFALFAGGFGTFSLLYCVQALLPTFSDVFSVSPAASSLTISLATGSLSVTLLIAGSLSESIGRKNMMVASLILSAGLTLACAASQSFAQLVLLRLAMGVALGGLPAIIMAYVGEEVAAGSVGYAVGLTIGGNAFGGMIGRVVASSLTDMFGWRVALSVLGIGGFACAALFWRFLPPSRRFVAQPLRLGSLSAGLARHFAEPGLRLLFLLSFLLMGCFVTIYNYVGFRLMAPPFDLNAAYAGAIFTVYLVGIVASAGAGRLADRYGRRKILWTMVAVLALGVGLTLSQHLIVVVLGIAAVTGGFFGAHSIASSWVARRAHRDKAQASSLYLFFYYVGSSVVGTLAGIVFADAGWAGVVGLLTGLLILALAISVRLWFLMPLPAKG